MAGLRLGGGTDTAAPPPPMLVTPGVYAYSLPEGIAPPQGFPASGHFWTADTNKAESLAVYEQLYMSGFKVDFHPLASIVEYALQSRIPAHHISVISNGTPGKAAH